MQDVSGGAERVRAWPRSRPGKGSKAQQQQREKFTEAQKMARYLAPDAMREAMRQVENSPLLPRDFLTMMAFGTMYAATTDEGQRLWPMSSRIAVSEALDILGQQEGMTLRRGPKYWEGVPLPAGPGQPPYMCVLGLSGDKSSGGTGYQPVSWDTAINDPLGWFNSSTGYLEPDLVGWYVILSRILATSNHITNIETQVDGSRAYVAGGPGTSTETRRTTAAIGNVTSPGQSVTVAPFWSTAGSINGSQASTWMAVIGPF